MCNLIDSYRPLACLLVLVALVGCIGGAPQMSAKQDSPTPVGTAVIDIPILASSLAHTPTPTAEPSPTAPATKPPILSPTTTPTKAAPTPQPSPTATRSPAATSIPTSAPTSIPTPSLPPNPGASSGGGRVIAIDPGHGGGEPGAVHTGPEGRADLLEKDANLWIALRLSALLEKAGFHPVLTRQSDRVVNEPARDRNGDGRVDGDDDLQARVDVANDAGASLFLSIHNNGSSSPAVRGTSTWYCADRPFGAQNRRLAELVQSSLVRSLKASGYADAVDVGAHDDPPLQKPFGHLFVVGPKTPRVARAADMPGVVGESLYVTNDREARLLADEAVRSRIAQGYLEAVDAFFSKQ